MLYLHRQTCPANCSQLQGTLFLWRVWTKQGNVLLLKESKHLKDLHNLYRSRTDDVHYKTAVENLASLKQQPYIFDILISRIKNSYHSWPCITKDSCCSKYFILIKTIFKELGFLALVIFRIKRLQQLIYFLVLPFKISQFINMTWDSGSPITSCQQNLSNSLNLFQSLELWVYSKNTWTSITYEFSCYHEHRDKALAVRT